MSALISRDPFAREELHRERAYNPAKNGCDWCGTTRQTPATGRAYLLKFWIERDDNARKLYVEGEFCCVDCMRAYHS